MAKFMRFVRPCVLELQPYQPGKPIEELEREFGITGAVNLASNENPRGVSQLVLTALREAEAEVPRYPDGSAIMLKKGLENFLGVEQTRITIGNGSNEVLELLARIFLGPGTESIVSEHSFIVYSLVTKALGGKVVEIPAKDYGQDLEAILDSITLHTRIIFIANPNNPTGTWVSKSALRDFLKKSTRGHHRCPR